jgi:Flp pilus assembly protein TadG
MTRRSLRTRRARRASSLRRFLRGDLGAAAAELALLAPVMIFPLLSVVDLAAYSLQKMQVEHAAEAGAQAIRGACGPQQTPVTKSCTTGLASKISAGAQSTSLGDDVSVTSVVEGYYCVNASQKLQLVGSTGTIGSPPTMPSPFSCDAYSSSSAPGDYVQVSVSYDYAPIFSGLSITSLFGSPITRTAWYRVE